MPDRSFSELVQVFSNIGRGKSKFLDCLYLVRQGYVLENKKYSFLHNFLQEDWRKSASIFIKTIEKIIFNNDKVNKKEASKLAFEILETYFSNSIINKKKSKNIKISREIFNLLKNKKLIKQNTIERCKYI